MVSEILGFLLNKGGGAWPQGVPGWCHWMCLSIRNKNIYGYGVGI